MDVGHAPITGICVEPAALEGNGTLVGVSGLKPRVCSCPVHSHHFPNTQPMGPRSINLEKRRARKSRKSDLIDEIRMIVGLEHSASTIKVLNAGAGIQLVVAVVQALTLFSSHPATGGCCAPSDTMQ